VPNDIGTDQAHGTLQAGKQAIAHRQVSVCCPPPVGYSPGIAGAVLLPQARFVLAAVRAGRFCLGLQFDVQPHTGGALEP